LTYYLNKSHNLGNIYFNFSQSYNAVNFNGIRVVNQNLKVDQVKESYGLQQVDKVSGHKIKFVQHPK
jgi:hypothetical protein